MGLCWRIDFVCLSFDLHMSKLYINFGNLMNQKVSNVFMLHMTPIDPSIIDSVIRFHGV